MRKQKSLMAICVAIMLSISNLIPITATAELTSDTQTLSADTEMLANEKAQIIIDSKTASPGETIKVSVSLKNNPGISGLSLKIDYDASVMTLIGAEAKGLPTTFSKTFDKRPYSILWYDGLEDIKTNGAICELTFKINEKAATGKYDITVDYDEGDISDVNEKDVAFEKVNGSITVKAKSSDVEVTGISLSEKTKTIKVGETAEIVPTIEPSNATNTKVKYKSSNDDVVKVDENGKITAVKSGSADITVSISDGKFTAVCKVVVEEVKDIVTDKSQIVIDSQTASPGETVKVAVSLKNNPGISGLSLKIDYDASVMTLIGAEAKGLPTTFSKTFDKRPYSILWYDGLEDIKTNGAICELTFKIDEKAATGKYDITVDYDEGDISDVNEKDVAFEKLNGSITVKAKSSDVAVTGISLSEKTKTIKVGETAEIVPTIEPSNATNNKVKYKSSNDDVVKVDGNGKITAVKSGSADITVSTADGKFTAVCEITVKSSEDRPDMNRISLGDVDLNGQINVTDIALTASHIKAIKALGTRNQIAADVDGDNAITVTDIAMIASHIKGIKAIDAYIPDEIEDDETTSDETEFNDENKNVSDINSLINAEKYASIVIKNEKQWLGAMNDIDSFMGTNYCWFEDLNFDGNPEFIVGGSNWKDNNGWSASTNRYFVYRFTDDDSMELIQNINSNNVPEENRWNHISLLSRESHDGGTAKNGFSDAGVELLYDKENDTYYRVYIGAATGGDFYSLRSITFDLNEFETSIADFDAIKGKLDFEEYENINYKTNEFSKNKVHCNLNVYCILLTDVSSNSYDKLNTEDKQKELVKSYNDFGIQKTTESSLIIGNFIKKAKELKDK